MNLLGVKAVVCETFERIHRSNLVGMGVLPLQFKDGMTRKTLNLTGHESFDVGGIDGGLKPGMDVPLTIHRRDGSSEKVVLTCRIDTARGGRVLQERRRAALRAAQPGAGGLSDIAHGDAGWSVTSSPWPATMPGPITGCSRACKALTAEEFAAPRTGFFPSLRATLNHILWVDIYYIDALYRDPTVLQRYNDPPPDFPDAHQLYDAQRASDRRLIDFCERQTEASLAEGLSPAAAQPHAAALAASPRSWSISSSTRSIIAARRTPC